MKKNIDKIVTLIFIILLGASAVYNIAFNNSDKISRIAMITALIVGFYFIFKIRFLERIKVIYLPTLIFLFFATFCARVLNFYSLDCYDKILHFSSGLLLGYIGFVLYDLLFENKNDIKGKMIFAITFGIATAGLWEVWEFSCDEILGMTLQKSIEDTMYDITCGSIGAIIISVILKTRFLRRKIA